MYGKLFVVLATSNDEYGDEATHCAIELRPGVIVRLAFASLVARFARMLLGRWHFYRLEVPFPETEWLNFFGVDADFPEDWETGAVITNSIFDDFPGLVLATGLVGRTAQIGGDGGLCFHCYHKHGGEEYTSHRVELSALLKAIRREDVAAELSERFTLWSKAVKEVIQSGLPQNIKSLRAAVGSVKVSQ
jgi:hypothetical protein